MKNKNPNYSIRKEQAVGSLGKYTAKYASVQ